VTYRFLPHTADLKVAIEGERFEDLFHDGLAVTRELVAGDGAAEPRERRRLVLDAPDAAELLLGFLKELLYWFATDTFAPAELEIESLSDQELRGVVTGERFDPGRHEAQPEVKAVTRHQLQVSEQDGFWLAQVVFDV
jgi:SHS2 domain-containing protein